MGITGSHPESQHHGGRAVRLLCQICGNYYYSLSCHVRQIHGVNITDLIVEGLWINERFPEY